jgi:UDP-N-acetylglucosamine--N-acetylmuramyl-(pentapeptide) pyrophosphoryl-undecaprenol N-acetylglucosamine transferase
MKIVMTGGGSGGHITPILAVAHELKAIQPDATITYIGQKGDRFGEVVAAHELIDEVYTISAGKFRRYHGEGIGQLLDFKTVWLNLRDMFRVLTGCVQAWRLLGRLHPDAVFCKGGFVGVPVGFAAALRRVPYITHDSDAIPGLANRIISRWAAGHAVALDPKLYPYPAKKTKNVGVPVASVYTVVTPERQAAARKSLKLSEYKQIILITGGGLGAARLNHASVLAVPKLLETYPGLVVVHTTGAAHETAVAEAYDAVLPSAARKRVFVIGYTTELYAYSAAADVVVARGGATNFAELAAQAKPCIIVPNPLLAGGHQLKNAAAYEAKRAVITIDETKLTNNHELLVNALTRLLDSPDRRKELSERIAAFARPDAAKELAQFILTTVKDGAEGV